MGSEKGYSDKLDISFILGPNDLESVPELAQKISSLGADLASGRHDKRVELLAQANALIQALETPQETMLKHLWASGTTLAALASGVKIGLFEHLAKEDGSPKKVADLATAIGIDPSVLIRILRHIAAMGHLIETAPGEYRPTRFGLSMTIPEICDGYGENLDVVFPTYRHLPSYVASLVGNKNPNPATTIFQRANNTDLNFFEYLYTKPGMAEEFAHHMAGSRHGQASWMDPNFYPVQELLVSGADPDPKAVFIVDVGGSTGHDIAEFNAKHPAVPGRLVLQDLPSVIETVKGLPPRIEAMGHDFFTEQPIRGARAYYMHSVLHDWSDNKCYELLTRVKEAMKPRYSKLLINEHVILSTGASWRVTALDITLFALTGSQERSEEDWRQLIEGVGLKICRIWSPVNGIESLIECELW